MLYNIRIKFLQYVGYIKLVTKLVTVFVVDLGFLSLNSNQTLKKNIGR